MLAGKIGDRVHLATQAEEMHRGDRPHAVAPGGAQHAVRVAPAALAQAFREAGGIEIQRCRVDVDEDRLGTHPVETARGREKRIGCGDDRVARADPERHEDGELRVGSRGHADRMAAADSRGHGGFEILDLAAEDELLRSDDLVDLPDDGVADLRVLARQIKKRDSHETETAT